jgi:hypothetical protein
MVCLTAVTSDGTREYILCCDVDAMHGDAASTFYNLVADTCFEEPFFSV